MPHSCKTNPDPGVIPAKPESQYLHLKLDYIFRRFALNQSVRSISSVAIKLALSLTVFAFSIHPLPAQPPAAAVESASRTTSFAAGSIRPDEPADKLLRFEVATIKPEDPNKMHSMEVKVYPGGRVVITGQSLGGLIFIAFQPGWHTLGQQPWMDKTYYHIEAVAPEIWRPKMTGSETSWQDIRDPRLREMLQALLIDRFHLKFHIETKTGKIYLLERSNKPLQLHLVQDVAADAESTDEPPFSENISRVEGMGWFMKRASTSALAQHISWSLKAPVLDRTGMTGYYNFESKTIMTKEDFGNSGSGDSTFMDAVKEMGFKVTPSTGPVDTLVIDHVDENPSDN
jgi:uncharacterized protein (TIGR03435 family)